MHPTPPDPVYAPLLNLLHPARHPQGLETRHSNPLHIDLQQAAPGTTFDASVCIIGGGIAGLVLATRLAARGLDVHLLEAGGLLQEEQSQALYRAEMASDDHTGSTLGRFRTFGGSSTQWGGQLLPFTPDIFSPPPGSTSPSWPVTEPELHPFYLQAEAILGVDPLPFTADLLPALGHPPLPPAPDVVVRFAKWIPFARRNLANTLGAEALAHPRITVFSHANATELHGSPGAITAVRTVNYRGEPFTFTARHFVVCAGTVESSRLLLNSPAAVPNPHDQLGRYFHDHLSFHAAEFRSPARERALELLGPFFVAGTMHTCKLEASADLRLRQNLQAVMAHIVVEEPPDSGAAAIRNLLRSVQRGRVKEAIGANLLPVLRGTGDVLKLLFYSRFRGRRAVSKRATLFLNVDVEQAPNPHNRIRLSPSETDSLGMPKTIVDWHVGDPERDTAARYAHLVQPYLQTLGIDPGDWTESVRAGTPPTMADTYHAMGGLRMGTDPAHSVVDPHLTVHGVRNLSVASCAVFPSGSSSNPTFTLMALTLRLAERLAAQLSAPPEPSVN